MSGKSRVETASKRAFLTLETVVIVLRRWLKMKE